jgi:hypothetical protein
MGTLSGFKLDISRHPVGRNEGSSSSTIWVRRLLVVNFRTKFKMAAVAPQTQTCFVYITASGILQE